MIFRTNKLLKIISYNHLRHYSSLGHLPNNVIDNVPPYLSLSEALKTDCEAQGSQLVTDMVLYKDFLSADEENSIMSEVEPYLKRMRYEFDHWDDAIHGFRETERLQWNEANTKILSRVKTLAFPATVLPLQHVHVLDLAKDGHIKPHIDAIRFCGNTIAGLSLLSDSVMRLIHDKDKKLRADILLTRRSLYIMRNVARYEYTHEILANSVSEFNGKSVEKERRVSVICRNEPDPQNRHK